MPAFEGKAENICSKAKAASISLDQVCAVRIWPHFVISRESPADKTAGLEV
jgi:hypothetical protein